MMLLEITTQHVFTTAEILFEWREDQLLQRTALCCSLLCLLELVGPKTTNHLPKTKSYTCGVWYHRSFTFTRESTSRMTTLLASLRYFQPGFAWKCFVSSNALFPKIAHLYLGQNNNNMWHFHTDIFSVLRLSIVAWANDSNSVTHRVDT